LPPFAILSFALCLRYDPHLQAFCAPAVSTCCIKICQEGSTKYPEGVSCLHRRRLPASGHWRNTIPHEDETAISCVAVIFADLALGIFKSHAMYNYCDTTAGYIGFCI
jgi:hypothetical protein